MKTKFTLFVALMVLMSFVITACGGAATEAPAAEEPAAEEPAAVETEAAAEEPAAGEPVEVRWFVGLGAGSDEGAIAGQEAFVEKFNAQSDDIELVLEIVANASAYDTLATQIAAGNPPDIVGPVGIRGRDSFKGAWADMTPLIEATGYDLSVYDEALVEFYQVDGEGQLGIPFAIFPSFVIYNKDLFDEAGLPYPPHEYGAPYVDENGNELEWNIETMTELAKKLTVDVNGVDATSADFDADNVVQFGWMNQWTDMRGVGTMFGAGSLVDADGNAQVPAEWVDATKWTYEGFWTDYYIPNGPYGGAEFLQGAGGPFSSGNLAMNHNHLWYVAPWALDGISFEFDFAATPSYNGVTTSKMHADTFGILKGSDNPEAAFEVLTFMLSEEHSADLLNIYGGMPARISMQESFLANYAETNFPGQDIDWSVVPASMAYADNPNHESWMPSFQETNDRYNEFWNKLANEPGLDVDAEVAILIEDLQKIFDAAGE